MIIRLLLFQQMTQVYYKIFGDLIHSIDQNNRTDLFWTMNR